MDRSTNWATYHNAQREPSCANVPTNSPTTEQQALKELDRGPVLLEEWYGSTPSRMHEGSHYLKLGLTENHRSFAA